MQITNPLFLASLHNKHVFYRIDGNVDMVDGTIQNDFRLRAIIPTLQLLTNAGASITLATHIGRPKGFEKELSTAPLKIWLAQNGFPAITLLENLRFNEGEQTKDAQKAHVFAQQLADGMDFYINDAWGLLHRHDTSITILPTLFAPEKRAFGLLVKKELKALEQLKDSPQKPYVVLLGGGKVETKLPVIERLIKKSAASGGALSTIVILPALSFTFMRAMGIQTGLSLVKEHLISQARSILELAQKHSVTLAFPLDYTYLLENASIGICDAHAFPPAAKGLSIGPKSLELFKPIIEAAQTLFFNGAMGNQNQPETMKPLDAMLDMISESHAYKVIGGGNSVAEVESCGLMGKIDYCSTGGGSTLIYISDGSMPGLDAMK